VGISNANRAVRWCVTLLVLFLSLAMLSTTAASAAGHHRKHHHAKHHHKKGHHKKRLHKQGSGVPPLRLDYTYPRTATPLTGTWGVYTGRYDQLSNGYNNSTGTNRAYIAKSALQPRVRWFTSSNSVSTVGGQVREYVSNSQKGDPDALVQLATFALWPQAESHRNVALTAAQQQTYRSWVNQVAAAIGSTRAMVLVEPDRAVALKSPDKAARLSLAAYATRTFSRLPRTTVYIDSASPDWLSPAQAVQMLLQAGVSSARGFALGATHYDSLSSNVSFARIVAAGLAGRGVPNKHAIIDTADNGRPFTFHQYYAKYPHGIADNPPVCHSTVDRVCWALGSRPGSAAADPADVDGYAWFGRPWLLHQATPYSMSNAVWLGRLASW
jgi:endoglucanase